MAVHVRIMQMFLIPPPYDMYLESVTLIHSINQAAALLILEYFKLPWDDEHSSQIFTASLGI